MAGVYRLYLRMFCTVSSGFFLGSILSLIIVNPFLVQFSVDDQCVDEPNLAHFGALENFEVFRNEKVDLKFPAAKNPVSNKKSTPPTQPELPPVENLAVTPPTVEKRSQNLDLAPPFAEPPVQDFRMIPPHPNDLNLNLAPPTNYFNLNRPKFYTEELRIKEDRLLVTIVQKQNGPIVKKQFFDALNNTVAQHVDKMEFYDESQKNIQRDASNAFDWLAAKFPKTASHFRMLTEIYARGGSKFDWFFLIEDSAYVQSFRLSEFVGHLSSGHFVALGAAQNWPLHGHPKINRFCRLADGLLFSEGTLRRLISGLPSCSLEGIQDDDVDLNLAFCMQKIADVVCKDHWKGKTYTSLRLPAQISLQSYQAKNPALNLSQNLVVSNLAAANDIYFLHNHCIQSEMQLISGQLHEIEENLQNSAKKLSNLPDWPASVIPSSKPLSRFEISHWDYFTPDLLYELDKPQNARPLDGVDKAEIDEVYTFTLHRIRENAEKYGNLTVNGMIGGYRKFDPNRGINYLLDIQFKKILAPHSTVLRRFRLFRPLTRPEIFVYPEKTPFNADPMDTPDVNLILPVIRPRHWSINKKNGGAADAKISQFFNESDIIDETLKFVDHFERICMLDGMRKIDQVVRLVVILASHDSTDDFTPIIDRLQRLQRDHPTKPQVQYLVTRVPESSRFFTEWQVVNVAVQNLGADRLFVLFDARARLSADFVHRLQSHTLKGSQVLFPMPFLLYHDKSVDLMTSLRANFYPYVVPSNGNFDWGDFSIASFYGTDFLTVLGRYRQLTADSNPPPTNLAAGDLVDVFVASQNGVDPSNGSESFPKILRFAEPALVMKYGKKSCEKWTLLQNVAEYEMCGDRNKEFFAPKSFYNQLLH